MQYPVDCTQKKPVSGIFKNRIEFKLFPKYLTDATKFPEYYLLASFLFFFGRQEMSH